jgi:hypothetical protein
MKPNLKKLLEGYPEIPTLKCNELYSRVHDDNDGDISQTLNVLITQDSDVWISINESNKAFPKFLRFRFPMIGGGRSPRTRNALRILAEAIRLDNEADNK